MDITTDISVTSVHTAVILILEFHLQQNIEYK